MPRLKLPIGVMATFLIVPSFAYSAEPSRPNIVYILADDFGYGDPKCYNPDCKIAMPSIDRLVAEGVRFTDAHSGTLAEEHDHAVDQPNVVELMSEMLTVYIKNGRTTPGEPQKSDVNVPLRIAAPMAKKK